MSKGIVGILGGTFNPIHNGHVELARLAHAEFDIPEILVMPTGNPSSYKRQGDVADAMHRCNMVKYAIADYPFMKLSTLEVERPGLTFTSDTLRELLHVYSKIYFIIGADSLFNLPTWHESEYVMTHCHLLAANRDRLNIEQLYTQIDLLEATYGANISLMNIPDQPYSSTSIRQCVHDDQDISTMVNPQVAMYIDRHELYA